MTVRSFVARIAWRLIQWSKDGDSAPNNAAFVPLTPALLDDEQFAPYEEEFDFVFSDPKIRNIALTGSYGAGKSSVMESWDNRQKTRAGDHSCTFISLASFHDAGESTAAIEGEILNQLIHKTKQSNIPKSRFKRTADNRRLPDFTKALFALLYGGLTALLIVLLSRGDLSSTQAIGSILPWLIVAWAITTLLLLYRFIREDKAAKAIRRIKLFGNEIELFGTQGDSSNPKLSSDTFNRHMDDVLYLLNNSGSDVIVFEDIDRFPESLAIFEKLRELNDLANACRPKRNATLRFFLSGQG